MAKRKPATNPVQNLLDMAGDFVTTQKGKWEHKDWEAFLDQVKKSGIDLTDEVKKSLGHVLEASKQFYAGVSRVPDKKPAAKSKASARSKPKAKSKAKAKAKTKA